MKKLAKLVDRIKFDARCGFLVEQRDGIAVKSRGTCHVGDLHFPFAHQAGEMAADHCDTQKGKKSH